MPELCRPRKKTSIVIRLELCQWMVEQIKKGEFRDFSHTIEVASEKLGDSEKEAKKSNKT